MGKAKVKGRFSVNEGKALRIVYSDEGVYMGVIRKLEDGKGYKIMRRDGKIRTKRTLTEALKTVARAN